MKRTLLMIVAVALLLTQCRKPSIEFPTAEQAVTVSMTITAGPGSKTDISTTGGVTWSSDDVIYVGYDGKKVGSLTLTEGAGSSRGTFTGTVTLTGVTDGDPCEFKFFYLGTEPATVDATTATVSFAVQDIYAKDGKLTDASKFHVGYGSATGKVTVTAPKFSVASGKKVEFSPGNLYWDGSAFNFEDNQWSFANSWNANHVSHFFWSETASVAYAESCSASVSTVFFTNDPSVATADKPNPSFQVSGETIGTWRTLTNDEWLYLFERSGGSLWARVTLTDVGVSGVVLLPDGSTATASEITTTEDLATYGAVFLPASGYRNGTNVSGFGSYGDYWSSVAPSMPTFAYMLYFGPSQNPEPTLNTRATGSSVRLVRSAS